MLCFRVNILLLTLVVIVFCLFPLIALCFYNGDSSSSNDGYNSNHHYSSSNSSRKSVNPPPSSPTSSSSFTSSFLSALSMILISELGDKTFIIAAIMAMKHSQVLVFISSALALVLMTILSVLFGALLPSILSKQLTTIIAGSLFVVFGAKMIYEAATDQVSSTKDEIEEVSVELISSSSSSSSLSRRTSENSTVFSSASGNVAISASNEELSSEEQQQQLRNNIHHHSNSNKSLFDRIICSYPIFIQGFTITFLAEWGDRSQISTIALAAAQVNIIQR